MVVETNVIHPITAPTIAAKRTKFAEVSGEGVEGGGSCSNITFLFLCVLFRL